MRIKNAIIALVFLIAFAIIWTGGKWHGMGEVQEIKSEYFMKGWQEGYKVGVNLPKEGPEFVEPRPFQETYEE